MSNPCRGCGCTKVCECTDRLLYGDVEYIRADLYLDVSRAWQRIEELEAERDRYKGLSEILDSNGGVACRERDALKAKLALAMDMLMHRGVHRSDFEGLLRTRERSGNSIGLRPGIANDG